MDAENLNLRSYIKSNVNRAHSRQLKEAWSCAAGGAGAARASAEAWKLKLPRARAVFDKSSSQCNAAGTMSIIAQLGMAKRSIPPLPSSPGTIPRLDALERPASPQYERSGAAHCKPFWNSMRVDEDDIAKDTDQLFALRSLICTTFTLCNDLSRRASLHVQPHAFPSPWRAVPDHWRSDRSSAHPTRVLARQIEEGSGYGVKYRVSLHILESA